MIYRVIGLMSGSSLDGLDIVFTQLEEIRGKWSYEIIHADCISYTDSWRHKLQYAATTDVSIFLKLNTQYGKWLGEQVNEFIDKHSLQHKVHFIASHGHTVFHEPENYTTCQIGDGATIAATTALPVISDLRMMDVAMGGQGAPIVPIGDQLLFGDYDYLLNIGGIANITIQHSGLHIAFDVCPANQILNILVGNEGLLMDEDGRLAASGTCIGNILDELNEDAYYQLPAPKSLSNTKALEIVFPKLTETNHSTQALLHTVVLHIAAQIGKVIKQYGHKKMEAKMLVTGGGAFNQFLIAQINKALADEHVNVIVPDSTLVKYKEALIMALIGTLRWRGEVNVLAKVTGASADSIGGALWMV